MTSPSTQISSPDHVGAGDDPTKSVPKVLTFAKPLTPGELAEFFSVSINTVYCWVSRPNFPKIKVGRHLRFDLEKVRSYFDAQTEVETQACQSPVILVQTKRSRRSLKTRVNASRADPKWKGTEHGDK
ncbi:helix-turn-helix domain-containing protein [Bdellovibrionota bacterium FG-1]